MVSSPSSLPRRAPSARWRTVLLAAVVLGLLALCASVLVAAGRRATAAAPGLTAQAERTAQGVKVAVQGTGWPAGATVQLSAATPPGAGQPADLGTVRADGDGALRATKRAACSTRDSTAARGTVTIAARTADGAARAEATVPASAWVCASS